MFRWLGLWRLVHGRVRSDWAFLLAIWLLILSAVSLLAAGALYAETVEVGGLRRALTEAPADQRGLAVRLTAAPAEVAEMEPAVRSALGRPFGPAGGEVALTIRSSTLRPVEGGRRAGAADLLLLAGYENIERHAELLDGAWPAAPGVPTGALPAAISEGAAEILSLAIGDRLELADASTVAADPTVALLEVEISGIFRPDPEDAYWLGQSYELSGSESRGNAVYGGPLFVDRQALLADDLFERLDAGWRSLPRVEAMRVAQLDSIRAGISGLPRAIEAAIPAGRFVTIERELGRVLGEIDRSALVSRSGVILVTLQFGLLAGYAVLLVGGILAERRRAEVALLRARGASTTEVGLLAVGEAVVLSLPAALIGPWLALGLVEAVGRWGALGESGIIAGAGVSSSAYLVALAAGLGCMLALSLPALIVEVDLARVRAALGRPLGKTVAQRLGLDLLLVVLAAIGIVQLRTFGGTLNRTAAGNLEIDPLLVAAPAISLAAGAVLVVRLVPRVGELIEWLARGRRGVLLPISARALARRPLRYTRVALLLLLAATVATFGAMYSSTWSQSQVDQAAHAVGADLRIVISPHGGTARETAARLESLPGVRALAPVVRGQLQVGRVLRQATLLAIDAEDFARVTGANARADAKFALALLGDGADARSLELPTGSRRLSLTVDSDVQPSQRAADSRDPFEDWAGPQVTPLIVTEGGALERLAPLSAAWRAGGQRLTFELPAAEDDASPAALVAIEVLVETPVRAVGSFSIGRIESGAEDGEWQLLADAAGLPEWSFVRQAAAQRDDFAGPTISADREHPFLPCESFSLGSCVSPPNIYRWAAASGPGALPAVASQRFLADSGGSVGQTLSAVSFQSLELEIVGSLESFPTMGVDQPFVIVSRTSLDQLRFDHGLAPAEPAEWWVSAEPDAVEGISAASLDAPISAREAISRAGLTSELQRDPIALGLVGALLLGSLTAAGFALLGLLVNSVVSAREQLGDLALLRAMGVSRRQVAAWLAFEQTFLIGLGLLAGSTLGLLIATLVIPLAPLNRSGTQVVPEPQIIVPWEVFGLFAGAAVVLIVVGALLAQREVDTRPVVDVLRERDD